MENTMDKQNARQVRAELDAILETNFRKLDHIQVLDTTLPLDMVSVAALHLFSERENEIEEENAGLERYTRKTFFSDLTEIGFEIDDELMKIIQCIVDQGFVSIDVEGKYHADLKAKELVSNINQMFPGMPGMTLIAYVIQTQEEIISGRKDLAIGLEQFDKALYSRGKPLTFVHLRTEKKTAQERAQERYRAAKEREESRKASSQLKKVYSEKIASFREAMLKDADEPMVVTKRAMGTSEIMIKEVAPNKIREAQERERLEKARLEQLEKERIEREMLERERQELELRKQELERIAREQEERERLDRERIAREKEELERIKTEKEASLKSTVIDEKMDDADEEDEGVDDGLSIEDQIAAFEKEMATPCPMCRSGKIIQSVTESNRDYYKCDNRLCKFISWDKPHPFACPQCGNAYLLESRRPDGTVGLKCPLASCSFTQSSLRRPDLQGPGGSEDSGGVPKKKRLVRRVRR